MLDGVGPAPDQLPRTAIRARCFIIGASGSRTRVAPIHSSWGRAVLIAVRVSLPTASKRPSIVCRTGAGRRSEQTPAFRLSRESG